MAVLLRKKLVPLTAAAAVAMGAALLPAQARAADTTGPQAHSIAESATSQWNKAIELVHQINQKDEENRQTANNIRRLAEGLRVRTHAIQSLQSTDPTAILKEFDQRIAAITGDAAHATWSPASGITLPTKAALEAQIAGLKQSIAKLEAQEKSQTDQRDQLNIKAGQLASQSNSEEGRKAVDDFKAASELRKQAADVQRQIDRTRADLTTPRQDLALATDEHKSITTAISQLEQQRATVAAQWDQIKGLIAEQGKSAQAVFQSADSKNEETIAAQLDQWAKGLAEVAQLRQQAEELFGQAATQFTSAANTAQNLQNSLRSQSSSGLAQAQQTLQTVNDPQTSNLQKAAVLSSLAQLKGGEVKALYEQADLAGFLAPILKQAGITAPGELASADQLKSKIAEAQKATDAAFADANHLFEQLSAPSVRDNARVLHILSLYSWSQLNASVGNAKEAAVHLQAARALAESAVRDNIHLPALPAAITPAPATQPAQPA